MSQQSDLFGKTYDQQLAITGRAIQEADISPNKCIGGNIVFEPVLNGIRVTARDEQHRILWGFIASKGMLSQTHCPVAIYDTLENLLAEEFLKSGLAAPEAQDAMTKVVQVLDKLQETINALRKSITVKKVSEATIERAKVVARIVCDADRMISLEANFGRPKQSTDEQDQQG